MTSRTEPTGPFPGLPGVRRIHTPLARWLGLLRVPPFRPMLCGAWLAASMAASACTAGAPLPTATAVSPAGAAMSAGGPASATAVPTLTNPASPTPGQDTTSAVPNPASTVSVERTPPSVPSTPTAGRSQGFSTLPSPTAEVARPASPPPTAVSPSPSATPTPTTAPRPTASRTTQSLQHGAAEFQQGQASRLEIVSGEGARLSAGEGGYAGDGELLSEVHEAEFPFDNAVLSWNAEAPEGTSLRFELRVRSGEAWSGWYAMGEWRPQGGRSLPGQADGRGKVDVDTLKLNAPVTAFQYRVKLGTSSPRSSPLLRRVSVVYADLRRGLSGPPVAKPAGSVRDLEVPRHSQLEEAPSVAKLICSPTSLAMVMQYWGVKKSVAEVYTGVRDQTTGIYGNWPLNTAYAAANGFEARVDRFYAVEQLEQEIAAGRPVIISIAYEAGELTGGATNSTDGHLIVVRGFTPGGDVIVNDPIAPNSQSVRLVYKREQLGRIWLRSGGVVYLIAPR